MPYLYILRSEKDGNLYVGATSNLERRLDYHNKGFVRSTKSRRPLQIVYFEAFETLAEARRREWFFKNTPQGGKLKKKLAHGP
jgi:putative endonuclease